MNDAVAATSSGVPMRPSGCIASTRSRSSSLSSSQVRSTPTQPGLIAFTLILSGPSSSARARAIPLVPALTALYDNNSGIVRNVCSTTYWGSYSIRMCFQRHV